MDGSRIELSCNPHSFQPKSSSRLLYTCTMKKIIFLLLVSVLFITGCNQGVPENLADPTQPGASATDPPALPDILGTTPEASITPSSAPTEQPQETLGPDCYGKDTHPIGQSIASLYPEQTDYDEVMVWFCNGFEFEDILTALQTAELADMSAEQLLAMFEHGQTWDEIWNELGIVEP